mmetsp:Transcript_19567/g.55611  ORF Transcript_19567/g.55611 Transcript_19567/m.55611 type:complete len:206 (-) Transcript_19567:283-900(-)
MRPRPSLSSVPRTPRRRAVHFAMIGPGNEAMLPPDAATILAERRSGSRYSPKSAASSAVAYANGAKNQAAPEMPATVRFACQSPRSRNARTQPNVHANAREPPPLKPTPTPTGELGPDTRTEDAMADVSGPAAPTVGPASVAETRVTGRSGHDARSPRCLVVLQCFGHAPPLRLQPRCVAAAHHVHPFATQPTGSRVSLQSASTA